MKFVFCDSAEIRARIIVEDGSAWAVPTNIPITPGHTLVMPTRHVALFADLDSREVADLFALAERIKGALRYKFGADGFNVACNEGEVAGQSIPHFHLHIVPRKASDTGITEYEPRTFLYRPGSRETTPEAELTAIAQTIKEALA